MSRLQRRDDALGAAKQLKSLQRLGVRHTDVFGSAGVFEPAMLGPYARVVQPR